MLTYFESVYSREKEKLVDIKWNALFISNDFESSLIIKSWWMKKKKKINKNWKIIEKWEA